MRLDQVEHLTGEPDEREFPDTAGDRGLVAFIDFLEGEAEKTARASSSVSRSASSPTMSAGKLSPQCR